MAGLDAGTVLLAISAIVAAIIGGGCAIVAALITRETKKTANEVRTRPHTLADIEALERKVTKTRDRTFRWVMIGHGIAAFVPFVLAIAFAYLFTRLSENYLRLGHEADDPILATLASSSGAFANGFAGLFVVIGAVNGIGWCAAGLGRVHAQLEQLAGQAERLAREGRALLAAMDRAEAREQSAPTSSPAPPATAPASSPEPKKPARRAKR